MQGSGVPPLEHGPQRSPSAVSTSAGTRTTSRITNTRTYPSQELRLAWLSSNGTVATPESDSSTKVNEDC